MKMVAHNVLLLLLSDSSTEVKTRGSLMWINPCFAFVDDIK
jgi:hypothetical protein